MASHINFKSLSKSDDRNQYCWFFQGSTFAFGIQIAGDDGVAASTDGYTLAGQFKSDYDSRNSILSFGEGDGSILNDVATKTFWVNVNGDVTAALNIKGEGLEGVYDFELTAPDGTKDKALYGTFLIKREVTA